MAKRTTKKAPAAEKTTTYSTRFNSEQREQLEEAAALMGVSGSRFFRDATLRVVADTLNASPPNDRALTSMARAVADQLVSPRIEVHYECDAYNDRREKRLVNLDNAPAAIDYKLDNGEPDLDWRPCAVSANILTDRDVQQLTRIAENCPHSFVVALLVELRSGSAPVPEFKPRTDSRKLLND